MKEGAISFFRNFNSIPTKLNNRVESLRSNIGEGVGILKSVVSEIKSEIGSKEPATFHNIINHIIRFLLILLNETSMELKSCCKYYAFESVKIFKLKVD